MWQRNIEEHIYRERGKTDYDALSEGGMRSGFARPQSRDWWNIRNRTDTKEWRSKDVGSGMGVNVRNRLDARKRKGQMSVGSGMSVGVGNRLDVRERKGQRCVGSGMRRLDARESECSGVRCWDVRGSEGLGLALGARDSRDCRFWPNTMGKYQRTHYHIQMRIGP